jgi:hypothetical protein
MTDPVKGTRDVYREQLRSSIGGWSGMVIAAIPPVVFVVVNAIASLRWAIIAAVGSAFVLALYRLQRRQSLQQALTGLVGVLVASLIAARTGHAKGYFLLGIWSSFAYAAVFVVSLLVRRPLVGVVWEFLDPRTPTSEERTGAGPTAEPPTVERPWYRTPVIRRAYDAATLLAALIFLARGIVQLALFKHNATGWLAAARIAMGYPLTILAVGFGYLVVTRARRRA